MHPCCGKSGGSDKKQSRSRNDGRDAHSSAEIVNGQRSRVPISVSTSGESTHAWGRSCVGGRRRR